jgi:thiol:disulfide interchange protein
MAKTITAVDFDTLVQNAKKPIVLEFGADW